MKGKSSTSHPQKHYIPRLQFLVNLDGRYEKTTASKVQVHAQNEAVREKRWLAAQKAQSMRKDVVNSFTATFGHVPGPTNPPIASAPQDREPMFGCHSGFEVSDDGFDEALGDVRLQWLSKSVYHSPQTVLGAGRTDPFSSYPISEPNVDRFVDQYLSLDISSFGQYHTARFHPIRDVYFPLSMESTVSFVAASAYGALQSTPSSKYETEATTLKIKAIREVNRRLHDFDDSVIYSVMMLWRLEGHYGSKHATEWHTRGLQQMITRRGGFVVLDSRLQMMLAWNVLTAPGTLVLGPTSLDEDQRACYLELAAFTESVHLLSSTSDSPYVAEAQAFRSFAHAYRLLSGMAESQTRFRAFPDVQMRCRLAVLLHIHCIYLESRHAAVVLRQKMMDLRMRVLNHGLDQEGTLEILSIIIMKATEGLSLDNANRTLKVLRMINAVKRMSQFTLESILSLFFGYLDGRRYSMTERSRLWDVEIVKEEIFGSGT